MAQRTKLHSLRAGSGARPVSALTSVAAAAEVNKPFKYRDKWRATVTLSNGKRPTKDFEGYAEGVQWIAEQRANANAEHEPEPGGPTTAKLADALRLYAELYTINKRGFARELNRINHYLEGAGLASHEAARCKQYGEPWH